MRPIQTSEQNAANRTRLDYSAGSGKPLLMSPHFPAGGERMAEGVSFRATHWSVVLAAQADPEPAAREALARLCSDYWYPLYAFIRGRGCSPHDAEDLTQEFFYRFLERDSLMHVSPAAGRFRSFLLVCLKHFLANERERAHAQRRGGGCLPISLEIGEAETRYLLEPPDKVTPEVLFERRWAFAVLEQTIRALQAEYAAKDKADGFEDLRGFLPGGQGSKSQAELAAKRGVSIGAVDVAVHGLRQRFGVLLRQQVAQTVASENEVDEEIHYLMSVLGR